MRDRRTCGINERSWSSDFGIESLKNLKIVNDEDALGLGGVGSGLRRGALLSIGWKIAENVFGAQFNDTIDAEFILSNHHIALVG